MSNMSLISLPFLLKSQDFSSKLLEAATIIATSMYRYKYKTNPSWTVEDGKVVYLFPEDIAEISLRHVGLN